MRRPHKSKSSDVVSPAASSATLRKPLLQVYSHTTVAELIDAACRGSNPVWIDIKQRRRWLEAIAAEQRTNTQKMAHLCAAAREVGFDVRIE